MGRTEKTRTRAGKGSEPKEANRENEDRGSEAKGGEAKGCRVKACDEAVHKTAAVRHLQAGILRASVLELMNRSDQGQRAESVDRHAGGRQIMCHING